MRSKNTLRMAHLPRHLLFSEVDEKTFIRVFEETIEEEKEIEKKWLSENEGKTIVEINPWEEPDN